MHIRIKITAAAILLAALAGCGSSEPPQPPPAPPPVQDTAFGDLVGTMDRARGVQDTVQQQKEATDKAIENSEGASGAR